MRSADLIWPLVDPAINTLVFRKVSTGEWL